MWWPNYRDSTGNTMMTESEAQVEFRTNFRSIRLAYWINGDNPIGGSSVVNANTFYTGSVGYGPGSNGLYIRNTNSSAFRSPSQLIALADGVYAGRHSNSSLTDPKNRIGWRHGNRTAANVALADGHCDTIRGPNFPRGGDEPSNVSGPYTVYADPWKFFHP